MNTTDDVIIKQLKKDQALGVRSLFEVYYASLVVYGERIVKDRNLSEDLVQDFFVRLLSNDYLSNVKASDLRSYLFRSVRNAALSLLQKNDLLRHTSDLLCDHADEDDYDVQDEVRIEVIMSAIEQLPERTRMVVEKVMVDRMKYQEAADVMEISINTVKYLLKDGLKKLRLSLASLKSGE